MVKVKVGIMKINYASLNHLADKGLEGCIENIAPGILHMAQGLRLWAIHKTGAQCSNLLLGL